MPVEIRGYLYEGEAGEGNIPAEQTFVNVDSE
jgi:hypothetical protein